MAKGRLWTREDLLLALNLYYKIPFGQFNQNNAKVICLANLINRTPSSVAMQLSNFASLDPYHQGRGVSGLRPPGKLAQQLWTDTQNNWESVILESEALLDRLNKQGSESESGEGPDEKELGVSVERLGASTETMRTTKARLGQRFFRSSVIANYRETCCVCGMPIAELLIASHIIPWKDSKDLRLDPRNGLSLCAIHDKAFDRGLLSIDSDYRVLISPSVFTHSTQEAARAFLIAYQSRSIQLPDRFLPEKHDLETHRQQYFIQ